MQPIDSIRLGGTFIKNSINVMPNLITTTSDVCFEQRHRLWMPQSIVFYIFLRWERYLNLAAQFSKIRFWCQVPTDAKLENVIKKYFSLHAHTPSLAAFTEVTNAGGPSPGSPTSRILTATRSNLVQGKV